MTRNGVLLVVDALAVYRVTRLLTTDDITSWLRSWLGAPWIVVTDGQTTVSSGRPRRGLRYQGSLLIACDWCLSVWVAVLVVVLQAVVGGVWDYLAAALAFTAVAGILAERV